ncbi:cell envelope integrity protein CreD [Deminuibacter soli]|uniref:Cell envelope integrity protein CreD n=1 Tax=Deminuibacter soli TaxID=2291815 RepID=A0A3E1NPR2_9BACT|nr:cell envelope integrity protein CreD [Deminuibacter soli]RFM29900.1 cell envelope integrity protein CreD [Deminuibacter soli]
MATTSSFNNIYAGGKIMLKAGFTGLLTLLLLIPAWFVMQLVQERQARQRAVTQSLTSRWATAQTVSGPYIVVPYQSNFNTQQYLMLLPQNLQVQASLSPEKKSESIYQVLLYRSHISMQGNFNFKLPASVNPAVVHWEQARLYLGISDLKGMEETPHITCKDSLVNLQADLPVKRSDSTGFSGPVTLDATQVGQQVSFAVEFALKGSGSLHVTPLAANSKLIMHSTWSRPGFDGNTLPVSSTVNNKGFNATWVFNEANMPFGTALTDVLPDKENISVGVSMIQQADEDQYAKTLRCIKYALLVIGLTFALFLLIELLQHKPFHPVQYLLVGFALVVFYTLLLSFSEYIDFDAAYLVAAMATIALISLYAQGHFKKWRTAAVFAGALSLLYGFLFVIIRLQDTALLAGSIGLFVILSVIMYFSRKISWYPNPVGLNPDQSLSETL